LAGSVKGVSVTNCYATGDINSIGRLIGGLIGGTSGGGSDITISNCYATGNVVSTYSGNDDLKIGGFIGQLARGENTVSNCYATGNVTGKGSGVAGFAAHIGEGCNVTNCHATGNIKNTASGSTAGFAAWSAGTIRNCYSTGKVEGIKWVGGLVGQLGYSDNSQNGYIYDSYALGDVILTGTGEQGGGLVGGAGFNSVISGCQAYGNVSGKKQIGGLVGCLQDNSKVTITDCYAEGNSTATTGYAGGLIGEISGSVKGATIKNSFAAGNATTKTNGGSIIGYKPKGTVTNCGGSGTIKVNGSVITDSYSIASVPSQYVVPKPTPPSSDNFTFEKLISSTMKIGLQAGIYSDSSSGIRSIVSFGMPDLSSIVENISNSSSLDKIDIFLNSLTTGQTELGSVQNRLESSLEQISVCYDNLVSSRSTLRDADMGNLSADYIRQQILQQAAATLMSTANQSPAIALQLI
jgi:flagellin-like hook-associated protein FlgL